MCSYKALLFTIFAYHCQKAGTAILYIFDNKYCELLSVYQKNLVYTSDNRHFSRNLGRLLQFLHEHKLFHPSGMNAPGLLSNCFWQVGSVTCRFYCLKGNPLHPKGFLEYLGKKMDNWRSQGTPSIPYGYIFLVS